MTSLRECSLGALHAMLGEARSRILPERKLARLRRRRFRRHAARVKLERHRLALLAESAIAEEIVRRRERPVDEIERLSDERLQLLLELAERDVLSRHDYMSAMFSTLGTFEGDRALARDEHARNVLRQVAGERERRRRLVAA